MCIMLFITSCYRPTKNNNKVEEIDISQSYKKDKRILLSEIAVDISYVKLQTDSTCFFNRVKNYNTDVQFTKKYIFITDKKKLLVFDFHGKFLNKIGNQGKGPGEYVSIDNFTLLPSDSLVAIFSHSQQKVFLYTFDNVFLKSFDVKFWPTALSTLNKTYLLFANPKGRRDLSDYFTMSVIDKKGELLGRLINSQWEKKIEQKHKIGLCIMDNFYNFLDTLSYWEFQYDTIWRVPNKNKTYPRYYINTGKDKLPFNLLLESEKNNADRDKYIKLWSFIETPEYFFFRVGYKTELKHILYDKYSKQAFNIFDDNVKKNNILLYNDLDGGVAFWPLGNVSESKVFSFLYGYELKELFEKELLNSKKSLWPEKRIQLYEIIKTSKIEDNPIIMIVTLKDGNS